MLNLIALLTPVFVCLLGVAQMLLMSGKTRSKVWLMVLSSVGGLFFFADAMTVYNGNYTDNVLLVYMTIVMQYAGLLLAPCVLYYMTAVRQLPSPSTAVTVGLLVPPVLVGTASLAIILNAGVSNVAEYFYAQRNDFPLPEAFSGNILILYKAVSQYLYTLLVLAEIALVSVYLSRTSVKTGFKMSHLWKFLLNKKESEFSHTVSFMFACVLLLSLIRNLIGANYLFNHQVLACVLFLLLAFVLYLFIHICLWFQGKNFTIKQMFSPVVIHILEDPDAASPVRSSVVASQAVSSSIRRATQEPSVLSTMRPKVQPAQPVRQESLAEKFAYYIESEKPYLDPEISINQVAEDMNSNRTYISMLINQSYGMSFRDFINKLRIEESKKILLAEPSLILEEVASRSGFASDAQLVRKFREIEGTSPRAWQSAQK